MRLVQIYWEVMETTFRVLHQPSFLLDLKSLLRDRQGCRESFVAVVLTVMATTRGMVYQTAASYVGRRPERQNASILCISWLEACTKWLSLRRKTQTIEIIQLRLLICIAIQANSFGSNRVWDETKSLLTDAVSMGLHKDTATLPPSVSMQNVAAGLYGLRRPEIPPLEREIRRRLWATIVELELQASFDRGLPSFAGTISAGCGPPNNLADEDLDPNLSQLPMPAPAEIYTHASFLQLSHRSLPLRSELNKLINDSKGDILFKDLLAYDHKIHQQLQELPRWAKSIQRSSAVNSQSAVSAIAVDIQLRQYLLPLHIPFVQQAGFNPRHTYSRMVCINTASTILEYHYMLTVSGNFCLNILRDDVFRAALSLCHHLMLWKALNCTLKPNPSITAVNLVKATSFCYSST
jgi:Fungal specific transcription factor domain